MYKKYNVCIKMGDVKKYKVCIKSKDKQHTTPSLPWQWGISPPSTSES